MQLAIKRCKHFELGGDKKKKVGGDSHIVVIVKVLTLAQRKGLIGLMIGTCLGHYYANSIKGTFLQRS